MTCSSSPEILRDERGEYCLIPLTQGKFAAVDVADYQHLSQWKWYAHEKSSSRGGFVAVRKSPRDENYKQKDIVMSRVILNAPTKAYEEAALKYHGEFACITPEGV